MVVAWSRLIINRGLGLSYVPRWILRVAGTLLPLVAWADEVPQTQRFGDWEVVCEPAGRGGASPDGSRAPAGKVCKAVQRLAVEGTNETVFVLTVVPGERNDPVAIVSVPLGGYIVPGIELSVDSGKPYKLLIETCTAVGCHAGFSLSGRIDKEMRSGKRASFRVWTTKTKPADVSVSLNGFADALIDLRRRS